MRLTAYYDCYCSNCDRAIDVEQVDDGTVLVHPCQCKNADETEIYKKGYDKGYEDGFNNAEEEMQS